MYGWTGTLDLSIISPTVRISSRLEVSLHVEDAGKIAGHMAGDAHYEKTGGYRCPSFSATPAKLRARVAGEFAAARNSLSLTIAYRSVEPGRVECVPPEARVPASHFVWPHGHGYIDQPLLDRLLSDSRTKDDGSVEATAEDASAVAQQTVVRAKLVLRPGYYGYGGGTFRSAAVHPRSEPSLDSAVVGQVPKGARLLYTETRNVGGQTWFRVQLPGGGSGWLSSAGLSCRATHPGTRPRPAYPWAGGLP